MGEDDERQAGEEKAGYARDAEIGPAMETGEPSSFVVPDLRTMADGIYRWVTDVVGRNGRAVKNNNTGCDPPPKETADMRGSMNYEYIVDNLHRLVPAMFSEWKQELR